MRIALADKDRIVAESLGRLIDAEPDMTVTGVYADGDALFMGVRARKPDVLIVDPAGLAAMGIKIIWRLNAAHPGIRIMVLTASRRIDDLVAAVRAGVRAYLSKTTTLAELLRSIRHVHGGLGALGPRETAELLDVFNRQPDEQSGLTARQREILCGMVQGKSYREIASELCLTEKTVKNYTRALFSKLGVSNRTDAVVHAFQRDLVSERDWFPAEEQEVWSLTG